MGSENTISSYENIDLDYIDFDFSFDNSENCDGATSNPNKNQGNFDCETPNQINRANSDNEPANRSEVTKENASSERTNNQIDYTKVFTTTRIFASKDELVEYCRSIGEQLNMTFILCTKKNIRGTKLVLFHICCERSGAYRPRNFKKQRITSTKKCKCPFKLKATSLVDGGWKYDVVVGRHNHDLALYAEGHTTGKFEKDEYELTSELTKSFMAPNDILRTLKRMSKGNSSIIKHVNNARQKLRAEEMEGRRPIRQFQKLLTENGYFQFFRKVEGSNILSDIFFLHPESYKMMNAWPYAISLDCTYKTNRYGLPLLEVVGFSPTWLTFTIAYCFLSTENEETFVWALQNLRSFYVCDVPISIVTDRELGLINAVDRIFPESKHMLCRRHIDMAIKSKALKFSGGSELFVRNFVWKWNDAISSHSLDEWNLKWLKMEKDNVKRPGLLAYVKDTWLIPYEKKIVSVWVDQYMHFGTYTSNRVESEHHRVKREVKSHVATFDTIFKRLDKVMMLQVDNIKSSLEKCRTKQLTGLSSSFDTITGRVSHKAIKFMKQEVQRNEDFVHGNESICGCYFQRTHGLPCAHKLGQYLGSEGGIPLTSIHDFWKKLDIEMTLDAEYIDYDEDTYRRVWEDLLSAPRPIKKRLFQNLREGLYSNSGDIKEPNIIQSKGRPKKKSNARHPSELEFTKKKYDIPTLHSTKPSRKSKQRSFPRATYIASIQSKPPATNGDCMKWKPIVKSSYLTDLPQFMIPFILGFFDVESDGNCGYRDIAFHLWGDEDRWLEVRRKCYKELSNRKDLYSRIFGNLSSVEDILTRIEWEGQNAPLDKWMTLPALGHIIATAYNIVFVSYGIHGGYTFLPVIIDDDVESPKQTVVIGFIHQVRHFIALHMSDGNDYPLPGVAWYWEQEHDPSVAHLIAPYRERFAKYTELMNSRKRKDLQAHIKIDD